MVWVEPTEEAGRSRWAGAGGALSLQVCHAIRDLVAASEMPAIATRRAAGDLATLRERFFFVQAGSTALERDPDRARSRWWTFAGGKANAMLHARLADSGIATIASDDLGVSLAGTPAAAQVREAAERDAETPVDPRRLTAVKFGEATPDEQLAAMLAERDRDDEGVRIVLGEPIVST